MFGHGSPNFHRYRYGLWRKPKDVFRSRCAPKRCIRFVLHCAILALNFLFVAVPQTQAQDSLQLSAFNEEAPSDLKLRFAWGGGIPQKWQGRVTIENGSFTGSRALAITTDAPSTVIRRDSELKINHRISTSYGGVDSAIDIAGETSVRVELQSESGETFERSWTIDQLREGVNEPIDQQQNRISISRTPGDKIRVRIQRPHLVFEPGEHWQFETALQQCGFANQKLSTRFYWKQPNVELPIADAPTEFETDASGSTAPQSAAITVPNQEGVHNLWIEADPASAKPAFGQFRKPKPLARCVQIVVISSSKPTTDPSREWAPFQTLTPQQLRGNFRNGWPVPKLRVPGEPVRKGKLEIVNVGDTDSQSALEMGSRASLTIPIQLPKQQQNGSASKQPVRVTIRYRSIPGTRIGMNYLSSSQQVLHGMDSGVSVPVSGIGRDAAESWLTHTIVLWPEDNPGYLFVSNDSEAAAQIGEIKFEAGPERLPDALPVFAKSNPSRRQRMAFLESPDFGGLFQAQRIADAQSGQALDDWKTFYDSVDRLTQHLKANAYGGAFVTVAADGSSIFPSGGLASGPRFDSGAFASTGCDPVQKDVVELMLRMFDREGLKLVPVLALNSTLEQLESLRESEQMSFDLVSSQRQLVDFEQRMLPIYNPLDRTLQGICSAAIRGMESRYRNHRSFAGLALVCRPDCCTLLPGSRHGFDDVTLQRFLQSQNIDAAEFDTSSLLIENQEDPARQAWLAWRSQQMTQWYSDMAEAFRADRNRSLYLLPVDIYRRQEFVSSMSPSLQRSGDFSGIMQEFGLDFAADPETNGITLLAPQQVAPGFSLARNRTSLNIRQSRSAQQFISEATAGVLFAHRGNWRSVEPGINASGLEDVTRKQLFSPAGDSNRRRYIEAIRKFDCRIFVESGRSLPVGGEHELESLVGIVRELPAQRFEDIGDSTVGPVCMRQLSVDGKHYFYAINDSPWPVEVNAWLGARQNPQTLQASSNANAIAAPLKTLAGKEVLLEKLEGRTRMQIFLEPWSIYAVAAETNSTYNPYAVASFDVTLPEGIDSQLRKRLHQLKSKLARAKTAVPMAQLLNGSFESFVDPERSGWEFGNHEEANFNLDSTEFRDGRISLSIQTEGRPVWIRSNTLEMPETGRLSVSAWLRTADPDGQAQPRISLEGTSDGSSFYRFGSVGVDNGQGTRSLDGQWRRYVVHFDDLPEDLKEVRVGFDLMAKGQVSVDQVEVYDRWFDENDSVAMTQLLASAGSQLQNENSIDGARRVLESYWVRFLDQYIGREPKVAKVQQPRSAFDLPPIEMPSFELPKLSPKKPKRVPLFQRFQRRE